MNMQNEKVNVTPGIRRPPVRDIEAAIKAYYTIYISNTQIMDIFGCKNNTAVKLKKLARDLEIEREIPTVVYRHVNARVAFDAWNVDVNELIRNRQKLIKLGLADSTEAKEKAPREGARSAG